MGTLRDYRCEACGYYIESMIDGYDEGSRSHVHGISCSDCQELGVASIPEEVAEGLDLVSGEVDPDVGQLQLSCRVSPDHSTRPWYHPGPCPKCGTTMTQGVKLIMWD